MSCYIRLLLENQYSALNIFHVPFSFQRRNDRKPGNVKRSGVDPGNIIPVTNKLVGISAQLNLSRRYSWEKCIQMVLQNDYIMMTDSPSRRSRFSRSFRYVSSENSNLSRPPQAILSCWTTLRLRAIKIELSSHSCYSLPKVAWSSYVQCLFVF